MSVTLFPLAQWLTSLGDAALLRFAPMLVVAVQMFLLGWAARLRAHGMSGAADRRLADLETELRVLQLASKGIAVNEDAPGSGDTSEALVLLKQGMDQIAVELTRLRLEAADANRRADRMTNLSMALGILSLLLSIAFYVWPSGTCQQVGTVSGSVQ